MRSDELRFVVLGEPKGKGRPRFVRRAGRAYTDATTRAYETAVKSAAMAARGSLKPFAVPVAVYVLIVHKPPSSASKATLTAMLRGETRPTKRPDVENVTKAILDGMNGVAFGDDAQVVDLFATRWWGLEPRVEVRVRPMEPGVLTPA